MELDKIDRKILYELDSNCRKSLNSIAKNLRISRNVALYRLNRLKKEGIIKGAFTEINNVSLGYHSFRIFIKTGNFAKGQEERMIKFILSQKNLIWLSRVLGKWDLDLVYMTKDVFEFDTFREELFLRFNSILEKTHISLLTQIYHYPKDYLINKERKIIKKKVFDPTIQHIIDKKDEDLLYIISKNADVGLVDLASKLKLSVNTVKKRMKELEKKKIILGYRLLIDTKKLGYTYYKLHINLRNYTESDVKKLRNFLESKNYIIYTDHYISGEDFEIELHLKKEQEYLEFMDELKEKFGKIIKEHFLIRFYKEYFFRYLPEMPPKK
jgi:Lrp/AsnC family transcriptional regulator